MASEPTLYDHCARCGDEGTPVPYEWWCWSCAYDMSDGTTSEEDD